MTRILLAVGLLEGCLVDVPYVGPGYRCGTDADCGDAGICVGSTCSLPCPCFSGNGKYCGTGVACYAQTHACGVPSLSTNLTSIYACHDAAWTVAQTCDNGCYVAASGTNDGCNAAGLSPCACAVGNGIYCGSAAQAYALQNNCIVPTLTGNYCNLLHCASGVWSLSKACADGCYVAPNGTPDGCNP